jgi:hypothetical protein
MNECIVFYQFTNPEPLRTNHQVVIYIEYATAKHTKVIDFYITLKITQSLKLIVKKFRSLFLS